MTRMLLAAGLLIFSVAAFAQKAPLSVTVANPVLPVEVRNADPISVRDTDSAARQSVWLNLSTAHYVVPAGKVLVVEFVSGEGYSNNVDMAYAQLLASKFAPGSTLPSLRAHLFPLTYVTTRSNGSRLYTYAHMTRIYVDEGYKIEPRYSVADFGGDGAVSMTISGHLVDK